MVSKRHAHQQRVTLTLHLRPDIYDSHLRALKTIDIAMKETGRTLLETIVGIINNDFSTESLPSVPTSTAQQVQEILALVKGLSSNAIITNAPRGSIVTESQSNEVQLIFTSPEESEEFE